MTSGRGQWEGSVGVAVTESQCSPDLVTRILHPELSFACNELCIVCYEFSARKEDVKHIKRVLEGSY